MNPDNFDDRIRRKLDGIEPVFREKDWAQMHQTLRHHGLAQPWSATPTWLWPAAGVVSVAALLTTTVWLSQTNQQLRHDVQQLNQTVVQLKKMPAPVPAPARVDTVYLTRPALSPTDASAKSSFIEPNVSLTQSPVPAHEAGANASQTTTRSGRATDWLAGQASQASTVAVNALNPSNELVSPPTARLDPAQPNLLAGRPVEPTIGMERRNGRVDQPTISGAPARPAPQRAAEAVGSQTDRSLTNAPFTGQSRPAHVPGAVDGGTTVPTPAPIGTTTAGERLLFPLAAKPMHLDSANATAGISINQAVRRLRRLFPATDLPRPKDVPTTALTTPQATAVVQSNGRVRLGVSGELGLNQWALGLYGDVLLGRHWLIGLGLDRVSISGGHFLTDIQFFDRTRHDFRHDYAGSIDPRHDIINIDRNSITWQVPITLGYRLPVGHGLALTPTVGASTSLSAREVVNFTYRRAAGDFNQTNLTANRPVDWYHSWSVALGVEKRWGHLTVQASPYLVGPFYDGPLGLNGVSGGLRLRTLYAF